MTSTAAAGAATKATRTTTARLFYRSSGAVAEIAALGAAAGEPATGTAQWRRPRRGRRCVRVRRRHLVAAVDSCSAKRCVPFRRLLASLPRRAATTAMVTNSGMDELLPSSN